MAKINLTNRFIESVKVDVRTDFRDGVMSGLVLRVTPQGAKSWNLVYSRQDDGKKRRFTFGRFPALDLAKARERALKELGKIADGGDPANKRRDDLTVQELGCLFVDKYAKPNKRTWGEDERILARDVNPLIGQKLVSKVSRRDIFDVLDAKIDAGSAAMSNKVLAVVRKMFNWAEQEEFVELSPAARVRPRAKTVSRDRVLNRDEIVAVWGSLDDAAMYPDVRDVLKLLLLTGQRSGEVAGMLKGEIDVRRREWLLPKHRTKNGLQHLVPLSASAMEIIEPAIRHLEFGGPDEPLFARTGEAIRSQGVGNAVRRNQPHFGIERWTPHDLRRTAATGMAEIGVQPHIIEALLNHISGSRGGVAGVYNRAAYSIEKRRAVDLWSDHIDITMSNGHRNVVQLFN